MATIMTRPGWYTCWRCRKRVNTVFFKIGDQPVKVPKLCPWCREDRK